MWANVVALVASLVALVTSGFATLDARRGRRFNARVDVLARMRDDLDKALSGWISAKPGSTLLDVLNAQLYSGDRVFQSWHQLLPEPVATDLASRKDVLMRSELMLRDPHPGLVAEGLVTDDTSLRQSKVDWAQAVEQAFSTERTRVYELLRKLTE